MGKITAGVTHDIRNVLAVIRESAGLLEDLLLATNDGSFPPREKFQAVLARIGKQVARGVDLINALNQFAHNPDQPTAQIDINQALDQLVVLSQRFALSKRVSLKAIASDRPILLSCDPVKLQMIVFQGIDLLLHVVSAGAAIEIRPIAGSYGNVRVEFSSKGAEEVEPHRLNDAVALPLWEALIACAENFDATLEQGVPPVWFAIVLGCHDK